MKNKYLSFIFILLYPLMLFSQGKTLTGIITDEYTDKTIPYVNVVYLKKNYGVASHIDGRFELEKLANLSLVKISAIGYRDTIINIDTLHNIIIALKPEAFGLPEVIVTRKKIRKYTKKLIGYYSHRNNSIYKMGLGNQVAILIQDKSEIGSCIEKVKYRIKKDKRYKCHAYHRIRIFSNDKTSTMPQKDIINDNIILNPMDFGKTVEVDISKYNLQLPKDGVWVCIEWIGNPNCQDLQLEDKTYVSPYLTGGRSKLPKAPVCHNYRDGKWGKSPEFSNIDRYCFNLGIGLVVKR